MIPGDVLAGLSLGNLVSTVGWFVVVPVLRRLAGWLTGTPLRPLITSAAPAANMT